MQVLILLALSQRVLHRVSLLLQFLSSKDSAYIWYSRILFDISFIEDMLCLPDNWLLCWTFGENDLGLSYRILYDCHVSHSF